MSSNASEMSGYLTAMEEHLSGLSTARAGYQAALKSAKYATRRPEDIESSLGMHRVDQALAARMGALGLEGVLDYPRTQGPFGPEWTTKFSVTPAVQS